MGVEHSAFCHTCKTFIDGHKCDAAADLIAHVASVESPTDSDFTYWGKSLGYWGVRVVWFALAHKEHDVSLLSDNEDELYYRLRGKYKEEHSYKKMRKQRERAKP